MARYHITEDGPKPCSAQIKCPKEGAIHINGKKVAQEYYEKELAKTNNIFTAMSKNTKPLLEKIDIPVAKNKEEILQAFATIAASYKKIAGIPENDIEAAHKFLTDVLNGEIPEKIPDALSGPDSLGLILHTSLLNAQYYGRMTKRVAQDLAKNIGNGTVLDPMTGKGYFVKAMREAGVKTIGTDDNSWDIIEFSPQLKQRDSNLKQPQFPKKLMD